jgi:hypothetical protein
MARPMGLHLFPPQFPLHIRNTRTPIPTWSVSITLYRTVDLTRSAERHVYTTPLPFSILLKPMYQHCLYIYSLLLQRIPIPTADQRPVLITTLDHEATNFLGPDAQGR